MRVNDLHVLDSNSESRPQNDLAPGWVESEAVLSGDRWKTYLPQIPSRRLGKLSEIAESCVFLCNDKVSYINGEILDVNGAIIMD